MYVIKRDGSRVKINLQEVTDRIKQLANGLSNIDALYITEKTGQAVYEDMATSEIDLYTAQLCASLLPKHYEYGRLAARIAISNLHKQIPSSFSKSIHELYHYKSLSTGRDVQLINDNLYNFVTEDPERTKKIDSYIDLERDYILNYFGYSTLQKNYFLKKNGKVMETYQYLLMRCALSIFNNNLELAFKAYDFMSKQYYTHATPTLFNSGLIKQQLASCFLMTTSEDSVDGIYSTIKNAALVSKHAGGLGISVSNVRAKGAEIKGIGGIAKGIMPYLSVLNSTMRYADQGGSRRPGACCIYLEPWHADIMSFLDLRKNTGNEDKRCRDLFQALWIPDLFMKRVKEDGDWYLFCPSKAPELPNTYGEEFEKHFNNYVEQTLFREKIKARQLMKEICRAQIETGCPFMLYKDKCNEYSNQNNIGMIRSSNLCTEIVQYSDANEVATCNLASISVSKFVKTSFDRKKRLFDLKANSSKPFDVCSYYDFEKLHEIAGFVTKSLDNGIDRNYYPVKEAETSNFKHRPIGVGVQGLADVFYIFKLPYDSEEARTLNKKIFETIYHACLESSCQIAKEKGKAYESFEGSYYSKGVLHFEHYFKDNKELTCGYDWDLLRENIKKYGLANSLFTCCMPTASTAQILGSIESTEAITSNLYVRRVLAGDFIYINKHLLRDLTDLGVWNEGVKQKIMLRDGSVKGVEEIPEYLQKVYRIVWEIPQKHIIEMSADRAPFIDQSQSLNIFMKDPSIKKIVSMHCFGWEKNLKTGMYYLRVKAATEALKFTLKGNIGKKGGETKAKRTKINESDEIGSETSDYEPQSVH
eukprot:GAHX01000830.1.p1 GENE.GAHX01000830.1~~GAHX01000830.1.p1  ORF type:complete len:816 (+),score=147.61 GAHX01000830.1:2006-4453(+)